MATQIFTLISAIFFALSFFLMQRKMKIFRKRGDSKLVARNYKITGGLLLGPAVLFLGMALITHYTADNLLPAPDVASQSSFVPTSANYDDDPAPTPAAPPSTDADGVPIPQLPSDPVAALKQEQEIDFKLKKLNETLQANPHDAVAFGERGNVYAAQKHWGLAEEDYRSALKINPNLAKAAFNLAEMEFQQKKYDDARPGFIALKNDAHVGDLASYKVFLCDLYGGHDDVADKELDSFNQNGSDASYYFANIAWFLYHNKIDDAREWLKSAHHIYAPYKVDLYSASLNDLGYLPLPDDELN